MNRSALARLGLVITLLLWGMSELIALGRAQLRQRLQAPSGKNSTRLHAE